MSDSSSHRRRPPITLAHDGASAHEPPSSRAAFELALRLGASGVDTAGWLTGDGTPVLHHDGRLRQRLRRVPIGKVADAGLPDEVVRLDRLLAWIQAPFELVLDVVDAGIIATVVDVVRAHEDRVGVSMVDRLWFRHGDWQALAAVRQARSDVHLVDTTRLARMADGPERRAAQLSAAGIDAVQMPYADWTGGLVVLFGRFDVLSFASEAEHARMIQDLVGMNVHAISTRHPERVPVTGS